MSSLTASTPPITRFAPSPTGHLHVGGARTALFCWAYAQRHHGRFMIRIEDTDQARSSDESARGILEDLAWLGITWQDGPALGAIAKDARPVGPYFQAQRLAIYNAYIEHLVRRGYAYPAFETPAELDAQRKAFAAEKKTYRYPRPADITPGVFPQERWARATAGQTHIIRMVMPDTEIIVNDEILGPVRTAAGEVDDFVIRKADGFPTYHFAVVIDDELMGVTHVLRAQEHLINTPKHVALQRALTRLQDDRHPASGPHNPPVPFRTPHYAHMPLIFNADGTKMSKRDKAKAARKFLKDAMAKDKALTPAAISAKVNLPEKTIADFIAAETDAVEIATQIASVYSIALPEIEVWDYRASGYLPEVLVNYLALLGWSPGLKNPDGTDVDKFDAAFVAQHFSLERVGKTPARFDRVKLLAFNADALQKLTDEDFLSRWLAWLRDQEPTIATTLTTHYTHQAHLWMVQAIKPRAKTLGDGHKPIAFALTADDAIAYDPAAVQKVIQGPAAPASKDAPPTGLTGRDVLVAMRAMLADHPPNAWSPAEIDAAISHLATTRGLGLGAAAQPLRIALTGTTISPGLGHCCAILGPIRTLTRIDRALSTLSAAR